MKLTVLFTCIIPILLLIGLLWKSSEILGHSSLQELLFSSNWRPLSKHFGFLPFILSSVYVTILAVLLATPVCILTAIELTQYAKPWLLRIMQPVIDILAGIPSVVYGVWGVLIVVPFVKNTLSPIFGFESSGYSLLAASLVLAVMIIPFILNILIEIIRIIPAELTEASLALGAGKWMTIKRVILKKALPGIISAVGLGISRAFGETMAVLMVAGNVVKIPQNIFDSSYPLPALIANNYGEMLSIPLYDSALMFAALILFFVVIVFNIFSRVLIVQTEKSTSYV